MCKWWKSKLQFKLRRRTCLKKNSTVISIYERKRDETQP
jgi:hypothetical protein